MTDRIVNGDVGIKQIHTLKQIVVEPGQLRILETMTPVVSHQLIVCPDSIESVGINLMRMHGKKNVHRLDGISKATIQ